MSRMREGPTDQDRAWAAESFELIRATARQECRPNAGIFQLNLSTVREHLFDGSLMAFAKASQVHHSTLQSLVAGRSRPGLDTLLQLARAAGVNAACLMGKQISKDELKAKVVAVKPMLTERRQCKKYSWEQIRDMLEAAAGDGKRPSLCRLCRTAGIDQGYVTSRFPEMARVIVHRRRMMHCLEKCIREVLEELDVEDTVCRCMQDGHFPSFRCLRNLLEVPGCLRRPGIRELRAGILKTICTESAKRGLRKESMAGNISSN